jgi:Lectin C-type domain
MLMIRLGLLTLIGMSGLSACALVNSRELASDDAGSASDASVASEHDAGTSSPTPKTSESGEPISTNDVVRDSAATVASGHTEQVSDVGFASNTGLTHDVLPGSSPSHFGTLTGENTSASDVGLTSSEVFTSSGSIPTTSASSSAPTDGETSTEVDTAVAIPAGTECFDPSNAGGCPCFKVADASDDSYAFCFVPQTFWMAKDLCEGVGGGAHLVSIHDEDQSFWLAQTAMQVDFEWWIGLTDAAVEGTFVWDDGTPFDYDGWNSDEPNSLGDEDCGQLSSWGWNDLNCDQPLGYICDL